MKPTLTVGTRAEVTAAVTEDMCPAFDGVVVHRVCIDHLAPTPVGHTVRVVAVATDVAPTRVVCDCTAYDGDRIVGRGKQVQRVLPRTKLTALISRATR
ncbi:MAG: thioesterase family protein [Planctomycetota bacterium]|jgi:predicted thioesterase